MYTRKHVGAAVARTAQVAAGCIDWADDLKDTSWNCVTVRSIDRFLGLGSFMWGDHRYPALNTGNDIALFDISTDPVHPIPRVESTFGVPNVGDSDSDLVSFSTCDRCRYGLAQVFDVGACVTTGVAALLADGFEGGTAAAWSELEP